MFMKKGAMLCYMAPFFYPIKIDKRMKLTKAVKRSLHGLINLLMHNLENLFYRAKL